MSLIRFFFYRHCYEDNPTKCTDKALLTKLTLAHIFKNSQLFKEAAFTKSRLRFFYDGWSIQLESFKKISNMRQLLDFLPF